MYPSSATFYHLGRRTTTEHADLAAVVYRSGSDGREGTRELVFQGQNSADEMSPWRASVHCEVLGKLVMSRCKSHSTLSAEWSYVARSGAGIVDRKTRKECKLY